MSDTGTALEKSVAEEARRLLECTEAEFALLFGDMVSTVILDEREEGLYSGKAWGACVLITNDPGWAAITLVDARIELVKARPMTTGQQEELCGLIALKRKFVKSKGTKVS
jgi:hypothetical protein